MNTKKIAFLIILIVLTTLYANTALADTLNYEDYELPSYPPGTPLGTCRYVDGNDELYLMYGSLNDCPSQVYIEYNDQTFNRIGGINFDECGALYAAFDQTQMCSSRSASSATGTTSPCSYKISETDNIVTREGIDFTSDVCRCGNDFYSINDPGYCDDGVYLAGEGSTASSQSNPDRADYINSGSYPGSLYGACVFEVSIPTYDPFHVHGETMTEYHCNTYALPDFTKNMGWFPGTMGEGWPDPLKFLDSDASAMAAVLPPFCPHDISKLGGVAEYCHCGGETLSVSDGGRCDYADPVLCTDLDSCGDWQIGGYINPKRNEFNYSKAILRDSFNFFPSTLRPGHSGNTVPAREMGRHSDSYFYSIYSTWVFLDEDKVVEFRGEVNEGLTMTVFRAEPSGRGGWNIEEINRVIRSRQINANQAEDLRISLTESSDRVLEKGWYLINIVYWDRGGDDYLVLEPFVDGSRTRVNDAFRVVNSYGPLGLDPGLFEEEEDAEWACTSDPYLNGDWHSEWETDEYSIRCCGIDPTNFGTQAPDELVCTTSGWSRIEKCVVDGEELDGTHYLPRLRDDFGFDVACCGNNPESASDGGDLGRISPDGQFVCLDDAGGHPGTDFIWRDAVDQSNSFVVRQAEDTHFISNSAEWLYCDASGKGFGDNEPGVSRYGSFYMPAAALGSCAALLEMALPKNFPSGTGTERRVYVCDENRPGPCRDNANSSGFKAYCFKDASYDNNPTNFVTYCSDNCEIFDGFWRALQNPDLKVPDHTRPTSSSGRVDSECSDGRFAEGCFEGGNGEDNGESGYENINDYLIDLHFFSQGKPDSFICYDINENNYFMECCSVFNPNSCTNRNNRLNDYILSPMSSYLLDGQPLHALITNFDTGTRFQHRRYESLQKGGSAGFSGNALKIKDWTQFDYLHFQFSYTRGALGNIVFEDSNGEIASLDLNNYINSIGDVIVWQSVTIPLKDINDANSDFNLGNVQSIRIFVTDGPTSLVFHNFYLSTNSTNDVSVPGEEYFCSGPWGGWISNLDGPSDAGFGDNAPPSMYEMYEYACNLNPAYRWTGRRCCGDDTKYYNYGEWFTDTNGFCWGGAPVFNDSTIASSVSLDYSSRNLTEKSLLYYNGNIYSCHLPKNHYDKQFSYDGTTLLNSNFRNQVDEVKDPFSVVGSWMCQEGQGWVKLEDVNRVMLLSSVLNGIALEKSDDEYTLFCGDHVGVSNYLGSAEYAVKHGLLGVGLCVLRTGPNKVPDESPKHLVVGVEINDSVEMEDYLEKVIRAFLPFAHSDTSINCAGAPDNPSSSQFFRSCSVENGEGLRVYYNKPFNLLLISNSRITNDYIDNDGFVGFLADSWYKISKWWKNIFGRDSDASSPFEDIPEDIRNLYIAVQGDKSIVGTLAPQPSGDFFKGHVSYNKATNNISFLKDVMTRNNPGVTVHYLADGSVQALSFTNVGVDDWKRISSDLRLDSSSPGVDFGFVCPQPFRELIIGDDRVCEPPQCRVDDECRPDRWECTEIEILRKYESYCDEDEGRCVERQTQISGCKDYYGLNVCSDDRTKCVECSDLYGGCSPGFRCENNECVKEITENGNGEPGGVDVKAIFKISPPNPRTLYNVMFESESPPTLSHSWVIHDDSGDSIKSEEDLRTIRHSFEVEGWYTVSLTVSDDEHEDTHVVGFSVLPCRRTCEDYGLNPCRYLEPPYPETYEPNGVTPEPREYCTEIINECIRPNGDPLTIWCEYDRWSGSGSGDDFVDLEPPEYIERE